MAAGVEEGRPKRLQLTHTYTVFSAAMGTLLGAGEIAANSLSNFIAPGAGMPLERVSLLVAGLVTLFTAVGLPWIGRRGRSSRPNQTGTRKCCGHNGGAMRWRTGQNSMRQWGRRIHILQV